MEFNPETGAWDEEEASRVFTSAAEPADPADGDLWYEMVENNLYVYDEQNSLWARCLTTDESWADRYNHVETYPAHNPNQGFVGGLIGFTSASEDMKELVDNFDKPKQSSIFEFISKNRDQIKQEKFNIKFAR